MRFAVSVPITMHVSILVEAEDEAAAQAAAFACDFGLEVVGKNSEQVEIVEWEMHSQVVGGNVYYGVLRESEVRPAD